MLCQQWGMGVCLWRVCTQLYMLSYTDLEVGKFPPPSYCTMYCLSTRTLGVKDTTTSTYLSTSGR